MKDRLEAIKAAALAKINEADVLTSLNDVKVSVLGKKGELTQVLKGMKDVAPEDRPKVGQMVNEARQAIETALEEKSKKINQSLRAEKMKRETIDVTLPGIKKIDGHRHPNQIALEDLERVFIGMGYEIVEGPEVEYDKYNFELLNIPANHPAKDEQDTFYINDNTVVTHRVIDKDNDTESFHTKGDANETEDGGSVAYDKVVGKVVLNVPYLGYILR